MGKIKCSLSLSRLVLVAPYYAHILFKATSWNVHSVVTNTCLMLMLFTHTNVNSLLYKEFCYVSRTKGRRVCIVFSKTIVCIVPYTNIFSCWYDNKFHVLSRCVKYVQCPMKISHLSCYWVCYTLERDSCCSMYCLEN